MALTVSNLVKSFGGLKALNGVGFSVRKGSVLGLIGPNGSGKTTAINVLSGVYKADGGSVSLNGQEMIFRKADEIARAGLSRTFQNLRPFADLSVVDNIRAAQNFRCRSLLSLVTPLRTREETMLRSEVEELLQRFSLASFAHEQAGTLSYGDRKRLEMARALAMKPSVLLLDEPAAGMNPVELDWMARTIREIAESGVSVLLVEHHMKLVMGVCQHIVVLNMGNKIAEGTPGEIARHPAVIEAYLGKGH